jgi:hypothetical protein
VIWVRRGLYFRQLVVRVHLVVGERLLKVTTHVDEDEYGNMTLAGNLHGWLLMRWMFYVTSATIHISYSME